jgi:hypothetical protein
MYTVKELIEALKQCPKDYTVKVCVFDHEWGDIEEIGIDHDHKEVELFAE